MNIPSDSSDPEIDTTVPHSARVWNASLGGKDNFEVDVELAEVFRREWPELYQVARHSRDFLGRVVRYLVQEAGIRQFLDLGTGLPTSDNRHEMARRYAPECRVVYVDNDPLVLVHARALLTSTPEGATDYVAADLRDTATVLERATQTLDPEKPTAVTV